MSLIIAYKSVYVVLLTKAPLDLKNPNRVVLNGLIIILPVNNLLLLW